MFASPRLSLLLLVVLFQGMSALAQEVADWQKGEIPEWVERTEVPLPDPEETTQNSHGTRYLLTDWQVSVEPRAAYNHLARQILNTEGLSSGSQIQITFHPAFETLTLHSVDIFRDGEWTSRLDSLDVNLLRRETEMERFILDGSYTANISPADVRVGDILRYEFTISGANPVLGEKYYARFHMGWSDPLDRFRARIVSPVERKLETRTNSPMGNPEIRTTEWGVETTWSAEGLPGILWTEDTPPWRSPYPFVEISEYRNWSEVVEWALPLYQMEEPLPQELQQVLDRLPGANDPLERTRAILDWTREHIRYLGFLDGENSHRPQPPEFTISKRYGDCKAMAALVCTMLQASGIQSYPVLVNTYFRQGIADALPSPGAFDHVVVAVDIEGKRYFVDPTDTSQRGPLHLRFLPDYGFGLPIQADEQALVPLPQTKDSLPGMEVTERFELSDYEGDGRLTVTTEATGGSAERLRNFFAGNSREQISANYLEFQAANYPEIEMEEMVVFEDTPEENRFRIVESYRLPKPWVQEGENDRVFDYYPREVATWLPSEPSGSRTSPMEMAHPLDNRLVAYLELPEKWEISSKPFRITNPFFEFSESASWKGHTLKIEHRYRSKANEIDPDNLKRVRKDLREIQDYLGYRFSPTDQSWKNYLALLFSFLGLLSAAGLAVLFWLWRRGTPPMLPPQEQPRFVGIRGWLILVAFGTLLRPVLLGTELCLSLVGILSGNNFLHQVDDLLSPERAFLFFALVQGEVFLIAFLLGVSLLTALLLFLKDRWFPALSIFLLATQVGFAVYALALGSWFPEMKMEQEKQVLGGALLGAIIWIPYLLVSKRVKATFRR